VRNGINTEEGEREGWREGGREGGREAWRDKNLMKAK